MPESRFLFGAQIGLYALCGGVPLLLSLAFGWGPVLTLSLVFAVVCGLPIMLLLYLIRRCSKARDSLRNRSPMGLDDFHSRLAKEATYKLDFISAIRETLSFVHGIEPSRVYPLDALSLLCYGGDLPAPCQFEVVLGIANRLGVMLSESEVDRIGERIYRDAKTVKDLVTILYEEMELGSRPSRTEEQA